MRCLWNSLCKFSPLLYSFHVNYRCFCLVKETANERASRRGIDQWEEWMFEAKCSAVLQKLRSRSEGIQWERAVLLWCLVSICHPQWKESLQSRNVTMESDQFIVAQGYQDGGFLFESPRRFFLHCQVALLWIQICSHLRSQRDAILMLIGSFCQPRPLIGSMLTSRHLR